MTKKVIEASMAVAIGAKLCEPSVIPMYPITPQTHIVERLADFINDGNLDSEMIHVESEFAAISACLGASQTGVRVFTATASQGVALMHEVLHIVSGMRLPIVMAVANRALSSPINIWNDHQDSISARDCGWMQLYCESAQEALDTVIMAYRAAEDKKVLLPAMVCIDGFTLSHVWEPVDIPTQVQVRSFLPRFKPQYPTLDPRHPKTFGPVGFPNTFMGFKKAEQDAMMEAKKALKTAGNQFRRKFKRKYGNGLIEEYRLKGANTAIVCMGSVCGTARFVVDKMRKEGKKVGMIKVKSYRPFPEEDIIKATQKLKALAVVDKDISLGHEGALLADIRTVLFHKRIKVTGFVAGLGGRDIRIQDIEYMLKRAGKTEKTEWLM
jgi:pyruvate ferredoxin oxidoreductase alpha subunit